MKRTKSQPLPATPTATPTSSYRVALPNGPQSVIDGCASPADAYERYQRLHGILQSDFVPKIELLDDGDVADA